MSVASRNPFALLEASTSFPPHRLSSSRTSHSSPLSSTSDDVSSRPSTPAAAPAKKETPASAAPAAARGAQKTRGGPASRGGRYYSRGGKSSGPRENQNGEVATEDSAELHKPSGEGRGRGRGGRGRGGDRGRGGRRPFDRHSATGKTDSEKKVHQGWGGDEGNAELKAETAAETDAQAEAANPAAEGWGPEAPSADAWAAPAEGAEAAAPAEGEKAEGRRRVEEEEDNTLTLDEYLKQQSEKQLEIIPQLETRKANEGDDSIWKDAVAVTKKNEEEDAYFVGKTKASAPKARAKKEEKVYLEIDARFERPQRGGRGGRGGDRPAGGDRPTRGGRGRGGRGRGQNGNNSAPALNVDDQTAFPSLS